MAVFELQNVSFDYEGIPALHSLSLTVAEGERVALMGANGSGKSTLLRMLDGLYQPATGLVKFDGVPLAEERLRDDRFNAEFRSRVALVFQNPDVQLFNPTVLDEVAFGPLQLGLDDSEVLRRVEDTLAFMSLSHLRGRAPHRLSGGEKKKVALASVLVMDPEVLLLDEPTAALDPKSQSQLIDLIQSWKSTNKTVITATHQTEIIEDIADVVYVMQEGHIIAKGTPSEILSDTELLLRANLIHAHRHAHDGVAHSHPHRLGHTHGKHTHEGQ